MVGHIIIDQEVWTKAQMMCPPFHDVKNVKRNAFSETKCNGSFIRFQFRVVSSLNEQLQHREDSGSARVYEGSDRIVCPSGASLYIVERQK